MYILELARVPIGRVTLYHWKIRKCPTTAVESVAHPEKMEGSVYNFGKSHPLTIQVFTLIHCRSRKVPDRPVGDVTFDVTLRLHAHNPT